ncbi:MAG: chloride channel protein [Anaerolineae bacterium]|nr:chloride channel protein [Anaerolineae bacterium]
MRLRFDPAFSQIMHARMRAAENNVLLLLSVLLGLATGIAVYAFREAITFFNETFTLWLADEVLDPVVGALAIVLSLALAGAIVGWLMNRFVGEERHHGVAGVIESVALGGGRLPYKKIPAKAVASALSLGAGASVGPEDPSVQIGANIGSWIGQGLHLSEEQVRVLVAAGGAAAIAAAFKAPIAGVFFAIEVILNGAFESRSFGIVVLASVVASALTQALEPGAELGPFNFALGSPLEIPLFVPLGIFLAFVSVAFSRLVYWQHDVWHHRVHLPRPLKTALAGALVGLVAIVLPQIMGAGREVMNEVLQGTTEMSVTLLLALGVAKIVMTGVSMAGGFVGGIFAPALFVGTMLGSLYGHILVSVTGLSSSDAQAYAIAGMAAVMSGVVRSPITAIMLVFELTNDYRLILPIMLASVTCIIIAERFEPWGLYLLSLRKKGINLAPGREIDLMQGVLVGDAMLKPAPMIKPDATLAELRDMLRRLKSTSLVVVDDKQQLCGIVTLSDLQRAYKPGGDDPLHVGDICTRDPATITPEDTLWTAIRVMSQRDVGRLPVVKRGTREVVGLIGRHGVVRAYNVAVQRKVQDQHTQERVRLNTLTGGHSYEFYVETDSPMIGKRIRDVEWPPESVVASIERDGRLVIPHGDTALEPDDMVVVVADPTVAEELRNLFRHGGLSPSTGRARS